MHLDSLVELVRHQTKPSGLSVVNVYHGLVCYPDDPAEFVKRYPDEIRSQVLPFVKGKEFEPDQEYRFTVSVFGTPSLETVRFPISCELRKLAKPMGCLPVD